MLKILISDKTNQPVFESSILEEISTGSGGL
jgi:hypothetical protein